MSQSDLKDEGLEKVYKYSPLMIKILNFITVLLIATNIVFYSIVISKFEHAA